MKSDDADGPRKLSYLRAFNLLLRRQLVAVRAVDEPYLVSLDALGEALDFSLMSGPRLIVNGLVGTRPLTRFGVEIEEDGCQTPNRREWRQQ